MVTRTGHIAIHEGADGRTYFVFVFVTSNLTLALWTMSSKAISAFSPLSFLFQVYLTLLTPAFKCHFARSTAMISVSDGTDGKSYVGFPWLSHPIMSPREEGKKGRFLLHNPS